MNDSTLTREESKTDSKLIKSGIVMCDKAWQRENVPGQWMFIPEDCRTCEGYDPLCKDYFPTTLE